MTATQEIERIMEEIRRLTEELAMLQGKDG